MKNLNRYYEMKLWSPEGELIDELLSDDILAIARFQRAVFKKADVYKDCQIEFIPHNFKRV